MCQWTGGDEIEDVLNMKILGVWINTKCSMETHINKIKGSVCKKLTSLQPNLKYLDVPTRRELVYSKVGSIVLYGAELYTGQVDTIRDKFTTLMMRCNRYMNNYNVYFPEVGKMTEFFPCKLLLWENHFSVTIEDDKDKTLMGENQYL